MTKNNLAVHLKWLLKQGSSLYPSLTPSEAAYETVDVPRDSASDPSSPPSNAPGTDIGGQQENTTTGFGDSAGNGAQVRDDGDADMARLALAPHSASKPRMLSLINNASSRTPKTPRKQGMDESPSGDQETLRRDMVTGMAAQSWRLVGSFAN